MDEELIPGKLYSFTEIYSEAQALYVLPASKDEKGGWDINDEWTARVDVSDFHNALLCVDMVVRNSVLYGIFLAGENLVCVGTSCVKPCSI